MRTDSIVILSVSVLITAAIVAGAHLFAGRGAGAPESGGRSTTISAAPGNNHAAGSPDVSAETPDARTDRIIECHDPKVGKFYTNTARCEGADLENRISHARTLPIAPPQLQYSKGAAGTTERAQTSTATQKPNLRLTGKSPPPGLPAKCKFPVGKALETERVLAAAKDPYQSTWRDTYCRFRCEAVQERCPVSDEDFYYQFRRMCNSNEAPCYAVQ